MKDKLTVYFRIDNPCPEYKDIMDLQYKLARNNYYLSDDDNIEKVILLTIEQMQHFLRAMSMIMYFRQDFGITTYAGFKLKTLIGRIE